MCGNKVISYGAPMNKHGGKEKNIIQFNLVQDQFKLKLLVSSAQLTNR